MPNYVYGVVYRGRKDGAVRYMEPQGFPGSAQEFARDKLLAWMADNQQNANWLVVVNVWDADQDGAGVPGKGKIVCQLSNHDLDEGPFDPDQIYVSYGLYYIYSADYDLFEDTVLVPDAGDRIPPYGLVVPGEGPALAIQTGHNSGWISLQVARRDSEPAADLDQWEAIEQVTIKPAGEVRVRADLVGPVEDQYPDLRGGHDSGYLTIRASARGRDRPTGVPASPLHPRRTPVEHHLIETWPATGPAPRAVLKRDDVSRNLESSAGPAS